MRICTDRFADLVLVMIKMCVSLSGGGYKCFLTSNSSLRDLSSGGPVNVHKVFLCVFGKLREENLKLQASVDLPCGGEGSWGMHLMDTHTHTVQGY